MYGYIYLIKCFVNNKIYIGQRKGSFDPNYFGSGLLIQRSLNKYGKHNFSKRVLGFCNSQEELNKAEIECISFFDAKNRIYGYNIASGAWGGDTFTNNPDKEKIRIKTRKGAIEYNKNTIGKTNIEIFGKEKADKIREKTIKSHAWQIEHRTGKTWEELYGNKKAKQMRKHHSKMQKGNKSCLWGKISSTRKKLTKSAYLSMIDLYFDGFTFGEIGKSIGLKVFACTTRFKEMNIPTKKVNRRKFINIMNKEVIKQNIERLAYKDLRVKINDI